MEDEDHGESEYYESSEHEKEEEEEEEEMNLDEDFGIDTLPQPQKENVVVVVVPKKEEVGFKVEVEVEVRKKEVGPMVVFNSHQRVKRRRRANENENENETGGRLGNYFWFVDGNRYLNPLTMKTSEEKKKNSKVVSVYDPCFTSLKIQKNTKFNSVVSRKVQTLIKKRFVIPDEVKREFKEDLNGTNKLYIVGDQITKYYVSCVLLKSLKVQKYRQNSVLYVVQSLEDNTVSELMKIYSRFIYNKEEEFYTRRRNFGGRRERKMFLCIRKKRNIYWGKLHYNDIVFITPELLEYGLSEGKVHLSNFRLIVFDEAKYCVKNHASSVILKKFYTPHKERSSVSPQIIGFTHVKHFQKGTYGETLINLLHISSNMHSGIRRVTKTGIDFCSFFKKEKNVVFIRPKLRTQESEHCGALIGAIDRVKRIIHEEMEKMGREEKTVKGRNFSLKNILKYLTRHKTDLSEIEKNCFHTYSLFFFRECFRVAMFYSLRESQKMLRSYYYDNQKIFQRNNKFGVSSFIEKDVSSEVPSCFSKLFQLFESKTKDFSSEEKIMILTNSSDAAKHLKDILTKKYESIKFTLSSREIRQSDCYISSSILKSYSSFKYFFLLVEDPQDKLWITESGRDDAEYSFIVVGEEFGKLKLNESSERAFSVLEEYYSKNRLRKKSISKNLWKIVSTQKVVTKQREQSKFDKILGNVNQVIKVVCFSIVKLFDCKPAFQGIKNGDSFLGLLIVNLVGGDSLVVSATRKAKTLEEAKKLAFTRFLFMLKGFDLLFYPEEKEVSLQKYFSDGGGFGDFTEKRRIERKFFNICRTGNYSRVIKNFALKSFVNVYYTVLTLCEIGLSVRSGLFITKEEAKFDAMEKMSKKLEERRQNSKTSKKTLF